MNMNNMEMIKNVKNKMRMIIKAKNKMKTIRNEQKIKRVMFSC